MKKDILSVWALGAALLFTSCEDLNLTPDDSIVSSDYYKSEADATAAVTGIYNVLTYEKSTTSYYGDMLLYLTDLSTDYMRAAANSQSPDTKSLSAVTFNAEQFHVKTFWEQSYRGIGRANLAIDNIPNASGSEVLKKRLVNESKFLRALFYFNAVQLWGEIPLIIHGEYDKAELNRAPIKDVYAQIIKDLEDAQELPLASEYPASEAGRATKGAATALLAKVYLVKAALTNSPEDYGKAAEYAQQVIGSNQYGLVENFYDLWDTAKKNGREHIFSAQFAKGQASASSAGNSISHCTFSTGLTNNEPVVLTTDVSKFYDVFEDADQRKSGSYAKRLFDPAPPADWKERADYENINGDAYFVFTVPRFRKYIDTTIIATSSSLAAINVPVLRYADVLFTLAEAVNERSGATQTAYDALNKIRRRAYRYDVNSVSPADLQPGLTQEAFRDVLRKERYKEFVSEQSRWFDLVRWKILVKTIKAVPGKNVDFKNYRFPIPQRERDLNPTGLWQNWGYEDSNVTENPYAGFE
ncbi:SusD family protein [Bacteroidales bacterium Barb7]|nr:SusD family protein [Bacteroidales bacterium Barb7]